MLDIDVFFGRLSGCPTFGLISVTRGTVARILSFVLLGPTVLYGSVCWSQTSRLEEENKTFPAANDPMEVLKFQLFEECAVLLDFPHSLLRGLNRRFQDSG